MHTQANTHTHTHMLAHSLTHSLTLSLSLSYSLSFILLHVLGEAGQVQGSAEQRADSDQEEEPDVSFVGQGAEFCRGHVCIQVVRTCAFLLAVFASRLHSLLAFSLPRTGVTPSLKAMDFRQVPTFRAEGGDRTREP